MTVLSKRGDLLKEKKRENFSLKKNQKISLVSRKNFFPKIPFRVNFCAIFFFFHHKTPIYKLTKMFAHCSHFTNFRGRDNKTSKKTTEEARVRNGGKKKSDINEPL